MLVYPEIADCPGKGKGKGETCTTTGDLQRSFPASVILWFYVILWNDIFPEALKKNPYVHPCTNMIW